MKRSVDRVLTTHTGSLAEHPELVAERIGQAAVDPDISGSGAS